MNIVYFHGFGSCFDVHNSKVRALQKLGVVEGPDIDYSEHPATIIGKACIFAIHTNADLIVGCSMGGWLASRVAEMLGVPFVALNPAIMPRITLRERIGYNETYDGRECLMLTDHVDVFPDFNLHGCGMVMLEKGDELFSWETTKAKLDKYYEVHVFEGGSHRFESLDDHLELIEHLVEMSGITYGVEI